MKAHHKKLFVERMLEFTYDRPAPDQAMRRARGIMRRFNIFCGTDGGDVFQTIAIRCISRASRVPDEMGFGICHPIALEPGSRLAWVRRAHMKPAVARHFARMLGGPYKLAVAGKRGEPVVVAM